MTGFVGGRSITEPRQSGALCVSVSGHWVSGSVPNRKWGLLAEARLRHWVEPQGV